MQGRLPCYCDEINCPDSGDCNDYESSAWPCTGDDTDCPDGETDDCSECDTDSSGCGESTGSSGGSNEEEPDDEDDDARCDEGQVKNVNNDCVPCPNGNCDDCGDNQFRDICGKCTDEVISEPMIVEGECNGIRTLLEFQNQTNKEASGVFTVSGNMIVFPNNHPTQSSTNAINSTHYYDSSGTLLYNFFHNGDGDLLVNYWNADGTWASSEGIVAHYHTHPYGGTLSQEDMDFTQGSFSGLDHYYYINGNKINEYNQTEVTNTETRKCKKDPETTNNC